jgi:Tfp pilus assembly protein PilV
MAKRPAYSFIEVVVSLFLVSMGAMMFGALVPMAARASRMVGNYQQASSLVQHKIDELRAVGWGRLDYTNLQTSGIIDASPTTAPFAFTTTDSLNTIYTSATGTIAIADFSTTIKQITVTLTWTGSAAKQGNGTLTAVALIAQE